MAQPEGDQGGGTWGEGGEPWDLAAVDQVRVGVGPVNL